MKSKLCLLVIVVLVALTLLLFLQTAKAAEFSWRDDFNYTTLDQMRNAGWTLSNPSGVKPQSDGVVIDGTQADTSITFTNHFPAEIYNWTIEIHASWPGHGHSQPAIYVGTDRHSYGFVADGWGSQYGLYRDGAKPITFGSYKEQANTWVTLRLEKQGNILSMYFNGKLVNVYTEKDASPAQLTGVSTISPWRGDEKYDYYQVSAGAFSSAQSTGGFPIMYVAIGGVIAAIAVIGGVVYFFVLGSSGAAAGAATGALGTAGVAALEGESAQAAEAVAGAILGASGGEYASNAEYLNNLFSDLIGQNLFHDTTISIMSDLGYDCTHVAAPADPLGSVTPEELAHIMQHPDDEAAIWQVLDKVNIPHSTFPQPSDLNTQNDYESISDTINYLNNMTIPENMNGPENLGPSGTATLEYPFGPNLSRPPSGPP